MEEHMRGNIQGNMQEQGYNRGEFYLRYERGQDYAEVVKGLAEISRQGPAYQPESIERFRHVNCLHIRFNSNPEDLEQRLEAIEGVTKVERVPQMRSMVKD